MWVPVFSELDVLPVKNSSFLYTSYRISNCEQKKADVETILRNVVSDVNDELCLWYA